MTISDLITRLQAIQREHGTLPVYHDDRLAEHPLNHLIIERAEHYGPGEPLPARLVLHATTSYSTASEGAVLVR